MIIMADRNATDAPPGAAPDFSGFSFDVDDAAAVDAEAAPGVADDAYVLPKVEFGIEDLDQFLNALGKVAGFTLSISGHQRAKIVNGVVDVDRADAAAGRVPQAEFAAILKVLVGMMSTRRDDPVRPSTTWN